ncbi:hypothetical protein ACQ86F_04430 [Streptomyces venezuelae ATCC 10712]
MRRTITRFSHELIDTFCEDGEVELVERFAEHLPMLTLTHLLGMSDEDAPSWCTPPGTSSRRRIPRSPATPSCWSAWPSWSSPSGPARARTSPRR